MFESKTVEETIKSLDTDILCGLDEREAYRRLNKYGKNELKSKRRKTSVEIFFEQLADPLIYVLIAAAAVSVILNEISDSIIIGIVVFINAFVGMIQEGKAIKALESLKKLSSPHTYVIRNGIKKEISATDIVKGDIVCLEAGCMVPADLRLISSENLKIEESALTGETLPVEKHHSVLCGKVPLGDRVNMAYMSSMVVYGRGEGVVTAVGMETEIGKIAALIRDSKDEMTPLQKRLGELGTALSILSLGLCVILFVIAVLQKRDIFDMLVTAISLAVAAVPEGLPAVVTICLALSVTRMVKVNTIVRRLPSVETLGAVSVVCSDKTGTLTLNKMTVEKWFTGDKIYNAAQAKGRTDCLELMTALVLCNDASIKKDGEKISRTGDPTELALLDFAADNGIYKDALEEKYKRVDEIPFDSDRKVMTTIHKNIMSPAGKIDYTKGAPDEVLKQCSRIRTATKNQPLNDSVRKKITETINEMSGEGLRVLAASTNQVFLGMVGMRDPARPESKKAVETFKNAGVRTVMITGDHIETAFAIGKQLDIADDKSQCMTGEQIEMLDKEELAESLRDVRIFARVSPAQKVSIVEAFKKNGEIVAMTGDGINDAPSLKAADIGIAMGMNGTDVAKQAADMILTDDNFATIEKAIEEGRGVYENIRKSVIFLLSSNLGEILTMFVSVVCGLASPLKSSHILWINLITDMLPALALGVDVNNKKALMENKPRKADESIFARGGLACTCFYGCLIAAISLAAFLVLPIAWLKSQGTEINLASLASALRHEPIMERSQTYAFTVLGMSQLFHAVGMRDTQRSVFKMNHLQNKLMITACAVGLILQLAVTKISILTKAFKTSRLSLKEWLILTVLASFPLIAHELIILFKQDGGKL